MMAMRFMGPDEVRQSLSMPNAIAAMRLAFGDDREVPVRSVLGNSAFMPGRVGSYSGVKVVSLVPGNPAGLVAVFGENGNPIGIVDGPTLTAIRTGAGSGLATDLLASPHVSTLAMFGAGAMAFDQVQAVKAQRIPRPPSVILRAPAVSEGRTPWKKAGNRNFWATISTANTP